MKKDNSCNYRISDHKLRGIIAAGAATFSSASLVQFLKAMLDVDIEYGNITLIVLTISLFGPAFGSLP